MRQVMWISLLAVLTQPAWAACEDQPSPDLKHYCFAREGGKASLCNPIGDIDLRITCMAEISKDTRRCSAVRDAAKQDACYVNVQRVRDGFDAAYEPAPDHGSEDGEGLTVDPSPVTSPPPPATHTSPATHAAPPAVAHPPAAQNERGTHFQFDLANPSDCQAVSDPNQQHLCRGLSERDEQLCFPLTHTDFRYLCTAVLRGQDQFCMNIREMSLKETCRAMAR